MDAPWLALARQFIGVAEISGRRSNPIIDAWMPYSGLPKSYWHDGTAWCKIMVNGMLELSGYKSDRNAMARATLSFGEACEPKPGALMVMPRGKPPSGHIGIVDVVHGDGTVTCIEGNVGDKVVRKRRKISYALKNGFRWPTEKLDEEPAPVIADEAIPDTSRFHDCLAETLKWEGGWSNDKYDSGGATMKGVIQRRYNAYRRRKGLKHRSVRHITDDELNEIYLIYYWNEVKGDLIPAGLDQAVFDFGVNSGPSRSVKYLQRVLGVSQDGQFGPVTQDALEDADVEETIKSLCQARRRFVRQIKVYWRFGKGWERRINGIEAACLEAVGSEGDIPDVPKPKPEADAQSESQGRAEDEKPKLDAKTIGTVAVSGGGAVGSALSTDVPGAVVETTTSVPLPPQETMDALSSWQAFSLQVQSATTMAVEHYPYVLAAIGIYALIAYGLPYFYRETQT